MKKLLVAIVFLGAGLFIAFKFLSLQPITGGYTAVDRAVHWVRVKDELDLDVAALGWNDTEAQFLAAHPGGKWLCVAEPSTRGDRSCSTYLRRFDGDEAWYAAAFFRAGVLEQFIVQFPPDGYRDAVEKMRRTRSSAFASDLGGRDKLVWELLQGLLVMQREPAVDELTPMLWLSKSKIVRGALSSE
jgi:hypothetical protein